MKYKGKNNMHVQRFIQKYIQENILNKASVKTPKKKWYDTSEWLIVVGAGIAILVMLSFIYYIISESLPVIQREGLYFILGTAWNYKTYQFGMLYFIAGTLAVTLVTMVIAIPLSILTAIFLAEFSPPKVTSILRPMVELLVGIPSVVYGIFGVLFLENIFRSTIKPLIGSTLGFIPIFANVRPSQGDSILLAASVLAVMALPTITVLSIEAMKSVPTDYEEASIALGATKWETISKVIIPVSMPGIITGILLGMMRAMGETMAVVMLMGNTFRMPGSILDTGYAMTSKILNDILYYFPDDNARSALMGIALVLFVIEFSLLLLTKAVGARIR